METINDTHLKLSIKNEDSTLLNIKQKKKFYSSTIPKRNAYTPPLVSCHVAELF